MEGAGRLQRLKEGYQKRLVDNIRYLNDSYALMLKSAQIQDAKMLNSKENASLSLEAEKIIVSTEALLQLINELKQAAILNDMEAIEQDIKITTDELQTAKRATDAALYALNADVNDMLSELEAELYSSICRDGSS